MVRERNRETNREREGERNRERERERIKDGEGERDTERVRRIGEEVTPFTKEISTDQLPITDASITNTRRTLGFKWEVEGRLGYRKELNKEQDHADRIIFMHT